MHINLPRIPVTAAALAIALCAPAATQAKPGNGHGQPEHTHAQKAPKMTNVIVKGEVVSVDGNVVTVTVKRSNHHGRAAKGQQVQLDVSAARIRVKDVNGDGSRDAADVAAGDRVLAQIRVPRRAPLDLTQAFTARKLIDVGPVPAKGSDDADEQPEG
jgi:hypothetical protein